MINNEIIESRAWLRKKAFTFYLSVILMHNTINNFPNCMTNKCSRNFTVICTTEKQQAYLFDVVFLVFFSFNCSDRCLFLHPLLCTLRFGWWFFCLKRACMWFKSKYSIVDGWTFFIPCFCDNLHAGYKSDDCICVVDTEESSLPINFTCALCSTSTGRKYKVIFIYIKDSLHGSCLGSESLLLSSREWQRKREIKKKTFITWNNEAK